MSAKLFEELLAAPTERLVSPRNAPAAIIGTLSTQRTPIARCIATALSRSGTPRDSEIKRVEDSIDMLLEKMKKGGETWASMSPLMFFTFGERLNESGPERFAHSVQRVFTDFGEHFSALAQRSSVLLLQDAYWTGFDLSERRAVYEREALIARKIAKAMLEIEPTVPTPDITEQALADCLETFLTQWSRCKAQSWIASQLEYIRLFIEETASLVDATEQWSELLVLRLEQEISAAVTPRRAVSAVSHATEALLEGIARIATLRRISADSQSLFDKATSLWRILIPHVVLAAAPGGLLACEYAYRLRPDLISKVGQSPQRIADIRQALLDAHRASLERIQLDWLDIALRDFQRLAMAPAAVTRTLNALSPLIDRTAERLTEGLTDQRGVSLAAEQMRMLVREVTITMHCTTDVAHGRQRLRRLVATAIDVAEQPALWRKAPQIVAMLQLPESLAAFGSDNEARVLPCVREIADAVADQFTFTHRWWAAEAGVGNPNGAAANLPHCYPVKSLLDEAGLFRCVYGTRAGKEFSRRVSLTLKESADELESVGMTLKSIINALKFEAIPTTSAGELLHGLSDGVDAMAAGALIAIQAEHMTALAASHLSMRLNDANPDERTAALGKRDMPMVLQFGRSDTLWTLRRLSQLLLTTEGGVEDRLYWWWSLAVAKYIVRLPPVLAQYHVEAVDRALREILPAAVAELTSARIEALYRRVFDIPKAARRAVSPVTPIPAETKQRRALLGNGTASMGGVAIRDEEICAAAPKSLASIATGLHSALLADADEEMLWVGRTRAIVLAMHAVGADALETQWRSWIAALDNCLPPLEAARWTLVLLRGLQYARDVALGTELRAITEAKAQRVQAWVEARATTGEKPLLTAQRIAFLLRSIADAAHGCPPTVAALNAGIAAIEFARNEPLLSSGLWQLLWGGMDKELPLQSNAARAALARLSAQMLSLAEGLADSAAFSRWLAAQSDPLFAEDGAVERDWRATVIGFVVCAITQAQAPVPAAAKMQRVILWSPVLERQTAEGWSDTWSALDGVLSERMVPRLRALLIALNGPIASVLYTRSKVADQLQFDGARRHRALLSGLPYSESAWTLASLSAPQSPLPELIRDDLLLAAAPGAGDTPVDPVALEAVLRAVAKTEVPPTLKRRAGLLRRETQTLDEDDRTALALCLRLAAMHRVLPAAEIRQHLHETLTLGCSQPGTPINTLRWFITESRERLAKQRELLPVLDSLQHHALGLAAAARFAEREDSLPTAGTFPAAIKQIVSGLQGTCGTSGLRMASQCLEAGLDPEKPMVMLERVGASIDPATPTATSDLLNAMRASSGKTTFSESAA